MLDIPTVCYITNYDLVVESSGRKLEDFESVYEVGINEYEVIKMVPTLYTTTSADFHLSRLNYILNEHLPFMNKSTNQVDLISKDLNKLIESSKAYFHNMTEMRQKMMGNFESKSETKPETISKPEASTKTDSPKKNELKKDAKKPQVENKENKDQNTQLEEAMKSMNDIKTKISEMDFKKFSLVNFPDSFIYEDNPKPQKLKCLNYIYKSVHNQTVKDNDKKGDLIYLDIHTLEGTIIPVTINEKGIFINNSKNGVFDSKPTHNPCISYTLVGLLCQVSASFRENFSKLISQVLNVETTIFLPSPGNKFEWLKTAENNLFYNYRYKNFNSEMESLKHMRLNKEWNEEFQAIVDLNFTADPLQNLTKEKLLFDFYKMFKDTAIEGAKLIREKKITPFNFFDNPRANSGYYMYGSIFFTVLEDNFLDFRTFTKDDQKQTYLGSNLDLRHINYLNSLRHVHEIKDFYFSLNCIVQFKGLRVHAQVITPGVIFNSEHLVEYGEGEEGVLKHNENFHEEFKKLADKLNLREITVADKNQKEYLICGNPEIKGVRGVDKRKYLFDLIHLLPRDLNFEGPDCNGCLIRPELVKEYGLKLIHAKTTTDYSEELKKINAEMPQECIKDPASYIQFIEEKYKRKEELFEKVNNEIKPSIVMDTTIGIDNKYLKFSNKNLEKDEKFLKDLAKFLKEEMLQKFLQDISKDEENAPNDCFSLTEYLHRYGIAVRYYGQIIKLIESDSNFKKTSSWIKTLAIRDIIRRSAKHIFNDLVKDVPEYLSKEFCAYYLNILLAPPTSIKNLESYDINYVNGAIVNVKHTEKESQEVSATQNVNNTTSSNVDPKKKKKGGKSKKKKAKDGKNEEDEKLKLFITETLSTSNKLMNSLIEPNDENIKKYFLKPSEFWKRIKEVANKRYGYVFADKNNFEYVEPIMNKFGLLRDFLLTVGIQISANDYELHFDSQNRSDLFKYANMPFKPENIIEFFPVVKDYQLPSEIHRPIFEQAEAMFKSGNFLEAAEKYKQLIYLSNEVYGQINHYSGVAHKKLGEISYLEGDYMNCIIMLQKAIVILEKLYEYDTNIVANSYSELSTYYHLINQDYLAFKYISRGLEILNFTYPKNVIYYILF